MKFSIIIPVYNCEGYLEECLNSIMVCEEKDMEVILVNDGSTDNTKKICEEFCKKDRRFNLINKTNGGVSAARNTGLVCANGKYILFMDADDYIDVSKWNDIIEQMESDVDFTAFSYTTLYDDGSTKDEPFEIESGIEENFEKVRHFMLASSTLNTCWCKIFKTGIIRNNDIKFRIDIPVGEDFLFVAEYFLHCSSVRMLNNSIMFYRQHAGSAMRKYDMNQRMEFTKILFESSKRMVAQYEDDKLVEEMYTYYFRVITNIFYEFASVNDKDKLRELYYNAIIEDITMEIVEKANLSALPLYKKMELTLFRKKNAGWLVNYYKLKARV